MAKKDEEDETTDLKEVVKMAKMRTLNFAMAHADKVRRHDIEIMRD